MSVPNLYILPYVGWAPNDALCGVGSQFRLIWGRLPFHFVNCLHRISLSASKGDFLKYTLSLYYPYPGSTPLPSLIFQNIRYAWVEHVSYASTRDRHGSRTELNWIFQNMSNAWTQNGLCVQACFPLIIHMSERKFSTGSKLTFSQKNFLFTCLYAWSASLPSPTFSKMIHMPAYLIGSDPQPDFPS